MHSPVPVVPPPDDALRRAVALGYLLHLSGFLTGGLGSVAGLVYDYLRRDTVFDPVADSHLAWRIRSFWWTLFWFAVIVVSVVGLIASIVLPVFAVPSLWYGYRMIKGWLRLNDGRPMPD